MNMPKKWLAVAVGLLGMAAGRAWASNTATQDFTISVTPVANVTLTISTDSWTIGIQDIGTSTVSWNAAHLTNTGSIDVSVASKIQSQSANWTASLSSGTANNYTLYVATSATTPNANGSEFAAGTRIVDASTSLALKGLSGSTAQNLTSATGAVDIWFRLDMPTSVTTTAARSMVLRFTATAL